MKVPSKQSQISLGQDLLLNFRLMKAVGLLTFKTVTEIFYYLNYVRVENVCLVTNSFEEEKHFQNLFSTKSCRLGSAMFDIDIGRQDNK